MNMNILTPREEAVLCLIAKGKTTKQIAFELGIAFKTAACHRNHLLAKLGVTNTAELVFRSVEAGLVTSRGTVNEDTTAKGLPPTLELMRRVQEENRRNRKILAELVSETKSLVRFARNARTELREAITLVHGTIEKVSQVADYIPGDQRIAQNVLNGAPGIPGAGAEETQNSSQA
jgi:DNA-binding CsgD family transcriptional regulator